jgi:hypothetical protein
MNLLDLPKQDLGFPWFTSTLLALSVTINVALCHAWIQEHDMATTQEVKANDFQQRASACSKSIDDARELSQQRSENAAKAIEQAHGASMKLQQAAQQILASPPTTAGNDCQSAKIRADEWVRSRGGK